MPPSPVWGATVTLDADTDIYVWGVGRTLSLRSGSTFASMTVNSDHISFTAESDTSVTIRSNDAIVMVSSTGDPTVCAGDYSEISVTVSSGTFTITPKSTTCTGGAGVTPAPITPVEAAATTTEEAAAEEAATTTEEVIEEEAAGKKEAEIVPKPISEMTIDEIKAEIARITALIAQLQEELRALVGGGQLTKDLKYNDSGEDVELLQTWLSRDKSVYPEGIVSGWFGPLTQAAVVRFQEKYKEDVLDPWGLTRGTGYVGKTTRAKLNALYGGF